MSRARQRLISGAWSIVTETRKKRFSLFLNLVGELPRPLHVLDVGGTEEFWETMDFTGQPDLFFTLLNLSSPRATHENFECIDGDARDLSRFHDQQFDLVFSNSVIEHVGDQGMQARMADEIRRVGKRYFVQTPNYYFPIEPHFFFPGFQWLPLSVRSALLMRLSLGWQGKITDLDEARGLADTTRLLKRDQFQALFPEATLWKERTFGVVNSFVLYHGW